MKKLFICLIILLLFIPPIWAANPKLIISINGAVPAGFNDTQITVLAANWDMVFTGWGRTNVASQNTFAATFQGKPGSAVLYARTNAERSNITGKEFDNCNSDEDLYEHDIDAPFNSGDRMRPTDGTGSMYLMNPDDAGWRAQIVTWYNEYTNIDGIFLDNGQDSIGCSGWGIGCPFGYSAAAWKIDKDATIEYIDAQLLDIVIFNGLYDWYLDNNYADVQGGMVESCILGLSHPTSDHTWIEKNINTLIDAAAASKITLCVPKDDSGDAFTSTERVFILAGFLLAQDTTYMYWGRYRDTGHLEWWPENAVDIGTPVGTPTEMADLLDASGLYVREYSGGLVLFNDTGSSHDYALTQDYKKLTFSGGGAVESDGVLPGSIVYTNVLAGTVTILDGEALILESVATYTGGGAGMEMGMGM